MPHLATRGSLCGGHIVQAEEMQAGVQEELSRYVQLPCGRAEQIQVTQLDLALAGQEKEMSLLVAGSRLLTIITAKFRVDETNSLRRQLCARASSVSKSLLSLELPSSLKACVSPPIARAHDYRSNALCLR